MISKMEGACSVCEFNLKSQNGFRFQSKFVSHKVQLLLSLPLGVLSWGQFNKTFTSVILEV